jgi:hypothetical protein
LAIIHVYYVLFATAPAGYDVPVGVFKRRKSFYCSNIAWCGYGVGIRVLCTRADGSRMSVLC